MIAEWLVFLTVTALGVSLVLRLRPLTRWIRTTCIIGVAILGLGATAYTHFQNRAMASRNTLIAANPSKGRPDGYVSSSECRACHPQQYESWHQTYHRTMTQVAGPDSIVADFNNINLTFEGESYHLEKRG